MHNHHLDFWCPWGFPFWVSRFRSFYNVSCVYGCIFYPFLLSLHIFWRWLISNYVKIEIVDDLFTSPCTQYLQPNYHNLSLRTYSDRTVSKHTKTYPKLSKPIEQDLQRQEQHYCWRSCTSWYVVYHSLSHYFHGFIHSSWFFLPDFWTINGVRLENTIPNHYPPKSKRLNWDHQRNINESTWPASWLLCASSIKMASCWGSPSTFGAEGFRQQQSDGEIGQVRLLYIENISIKIDINRPVEESVTFIVPTQNLHQISSNDLWYIADISTAMRSIRIAQKTSQQKLS